MANTTSSSTSHHADFTPCAHCSPQLRDSDVVAGDLDGDEEAGLEGEAAQDDDVDEGSLWALGAQVIRRRRPAHQSSHRGGDDQVKEQKLQITQIGVDLGWGGKTINVPTFKKQSLHSSGAVYL